MSKEKSYIYRVSQSYVHGYDTYDSFVIICDNEEIARNTHPTGAPLREYRYFADSWCAHEHIDHIEVRLIGVTHKQDLEIVCSSFNAG